ncbi:metal-dependent transcriptional regulator [Methanotorris igneus]|uniref:Iron (Metal) dependent repressor, DtxR family n=1 Tax=Methanotorris igneus (strain DSM 5666 / JCM 11834 / Kol 5) TaxID=880724 RepID=F6BEY1_METIK|nr:metal-dependent transcriptional regulator [Methanotorris igneus]AEF95717.1 iron (metal) dependent repressor, DtxR family [Methanotorris igneus Kol 5]
MPSANMEDYLEKIYLFTKNKNRPIKTTELAKLLNVKPSAITDMAKKMSKEGYIIYEPYVGISLSEEGEKIAKKTLRKHRIIETFLTNFLGMDLDKAYEEACKIEHVVSDETVERLYSFMNKPKTCPHGENIE